MRLPADPKTIARVLDAFERAPGPTASRVAESFGLSTAEVTRIAKWLVVQGLVYDTGFALKYERGSGWQYIERLKSEGGMRSKPGASTQWEAMTIADQHDDDYLFELQHDWTPAQHRGYALLHQSEGDELMTLLRRILSGRPL